MEQPPAAALPPERVTIGPDGVIVPATLLGPALGLPPADVPALLRAGAITSRLEQGQDADAGTYRLTFYHGARALRLIVDTAGHILKQTRFPVTPRPVTPGPAAPPAHRP